MMSDSSQSDQSEAVIAALRRDLTELRQLWEAEASLGQSRTLRLADLERAVLRLEREIAALRAQRRGGKAVSDGCSVCGGTGEVQVAVYPEPLWNPCPACGDGNLNRLANLTRAVLRLENRVAALAETLAVLADPDLVAAIRSSEADIAAGRVVPWEEVKAQRKGGDDD